MTRKSGATGQPSWPTRLLLALAVLACGVLWWAMDGVRWLSIDTLGELHRRWADRVDAHPWRASLIFFAVYVLATGLSLPGAATGLTLLGGALFGFLHGGLLVSFASSIGATLAFVCARFVLQGPIRQRYGLLMSQIDKGVAKEGALYLFGLRLVPVFPFFLVNLLMGLTRLPVRTFYWVSQVGMLPATLAYVYAGTRLGSLESISQVLTPPWLAALAILGVMPWGARRALDALKTRQARRSWRRPRQFDRNLIVIGAGSAGLVTANLAAATRASVTLVEARRMGGDCLNAGCVPSKALLHAAQVAAMTRGIRSSNRSPGPDSIDFPAVMRGVREAVARIAPHDSVERYQSLGVDVIQGRARLLTPWEIEVSTAQGSRRLSARHLIIATGARPRWPDLPGLSDRDCLSAETLWDLDRLPSPLVILGAGPQGCEMALAFARLGSQVTLIERGDRVLPREDDDVSAFVAALLTREGVTVHTGLTPLRIDDHPFERDASKDHPVMPSSPSDRRWLVCEPARCFEFDRLLCALGRVPQLEGLGLEALGIGVGEDGRLELDACLRTRLPSILAVGDVTGLPQLTHAASHMAWHGTINALFGRFRRFAVDWRVLPQVIYLDPEVARVGLTEREAREQGLDVEVTRFDGTRLDRAIVDGAEPGFTKVLTARNSDRILGATIVSARAGESIAEFALAMRHGLGLNRILSTVHAYPTYAEANRLVAGQWRRTRTPEWVLRWAERLHRWERG